MRSALCVAVLGIVCLLGAGPAAAMPYQQDWKRAAKKAHFSKVPAPGVLPGFRTAPAPSASLRSTPSTT